MPKTVPKPKLQPNGRWKLRITVPSDLRDLGFANGVREVIRTHPPSSKRVAMLWAQREFLSFESQVAAFKLKQSGEITPELREEYLKLARLGQSDENAGLAADAPFDETLQTGVNPKTINRKPGAIKGYYGHLIERGLIDRRGPYGRPSDDLKTASTQAAKASTKNQTRPRTDEEVAQLYEAAKSGRIPQVVDMIVLGMFTGARIESLYRIRKRDVDLEAATVLIGADGDKTEAGQDRLIPIARSLLPTMERLVARTDAPEDYLLRLRGKGDKRSDPDGKRFGRLKEKLFPGEGRKATFHSFRKTFITKLGNEVSAPEHVIRDIVRDIVGHDNTKNVTMSLYRARMSPEEMRPYVDSLVYAGWQE